MQLCDLPDDVLIPVLRASCLNGAPYLDLDDNRRLLAISRRLRRLALPLVYRTAYLCFYEDPPVDSTGESSSAIDTSLSLIAAVDCVDLVKEVSVAVCRRTETPWALLRAAQAIRHSANIWPRVESLSIEAMTPTIDDGDIAGASMQDGNDARSAAEALSSLFPRVRRLNFWGKDEGNVIGLNWGQLAGHYAEQLEGLWLKYNIALPRDVYFQRLRHVYITCGTTSDYAFPRINPATLEEMCVYRAPPSLDLDAFGASDDSPDIVFPELKSIVLMYRNSRNIFIDSMQTPRPDSPPWRLHLPQVRSICYYCDQTTCSFIENAVLPAAVDSFAIAGNTALLTSVAAKPLPTTQDLDLEVIDDWDNTPEVFTAVNNILSIMRPCERAMLNISDENLPVRPEDITFTGLTELHIASPTSVCTTIELILKLPQLVRLHIRYYTVHDIPPDVTAPTPDEPELLPPLDTRIETLGLCRMRGGLHSKQDSRVWQYMLLRVPSLTCAYLTDVTHEEFGDFVANYSQHYPHLSSIQLLDWGRDP